MMDKGLIAAGTVLAILVPILVISIAVGVKQVVAGHIETYQRDYTACLALQSKPTLKDMAVCKDLASGITPMFSNTTGESNVP